MEIAAKISAVEFLQRKGALEVLASASNRDDLVFAAGLAFEKVLGAGRQRLGHCPS